MTMSGREKRLAEKVDDFIRTQRRRVAYQLSILSIAKNSFLALPPNFIPLKENERDIEKIKGIITDWETKSKEAKKAKTEEESEDGDGEGKKEMRFETVIKRIEAIVQNKQGESWKQYQQQLLWLKELQKMIKEKQPFENVIGFIKPHLNQKQGETIDYLYFLYQHYMQMEEYIDNQMKLGVSDHPVWTQWLNQVKGIELRLAAKVVGVMASAFKEGEGPEHYRTVSQAWSFLGLGTVKGKAARRTKGEPLHYNSTAKSVLLGQVGPSLIRAQGAYYNLYKSRRAYEEQRGAKNIHRRANRWMIKIFVSHALEIWWNAYGLPTRQARQDQLVETGRLPYAFHILNHSMDNLIEPIRDREQAKVYKEITPRA